MSSTEYQPWESLIEGAAEPGCRAIVILPAKNEEQTLDAALDAASAQVALDGTPLDQASFEIILLLNNCTDDSASVARRWKHAHPDVRLHVPERELPPGQAFVGTARKLLMDTAWHRLRDRPGLCAILSTDSDTLVHPDWVARNLAALAGGSDAVGGAIAMKDGELEQLPNGVRLAYRRDRRYQHLVAELEDCLDPQVGDPWPRHLQHFGASLACTPQIYARAGGMPAVTPLEDVAFVNALRRIGARLRHDPAVQVVTSSRMNGRVEIGLSGQLSLWQRMSVQGEQHRVQSAAWLAHRFRTLAKLRQQAADKGIAAADYLAQVDCDRRIDESFRGSREGEITRVNRRLAAMLRRERPLRAPADQADTRHAAAR